jgi:hypothetical protein
MGVVGGCWGLEHRGASGARAFSLASCAAGEILGLLALASVPRLRGHKHKPAPQGRRGGKLRRTAGGLHFFGGELR